MIKSWINDLNTTSFRIITSCIIAFSLSHIIVIAMVWRAYEPTKIHLTVFGGILGGLLTMMGFDVLQFASKRFSDSGYAAAKNPPTQVIAPSSTVAVQGSAVVTDAALPPNHPVP